MKITSKFKEYDVELKESLDFIDKLTKIPNSQFVIDERVYGLYQEYFSNIRKEQLFLLEAIEEKKVIETALEICEVMTSIPAKRNAVLISIGGGIVQDITGFVANILYRGIRWIFVPTTLLASCDSCIGGKTSLNYKGYKNLLGTFYPPDKIFICPQFFKTLTERDYKSGLGEVVKFNLMMGNSGLEQIEESLGKLLSRDPKVVNQFVHKSLAFKKEFIEKDEFDRGERIKLNFAHTFGHAIEVMTKYEIPHGTAVAIGMIIANHLSVKRGLLDKEYEIQAKKLLLRVIDINVALMKRPIEVMIDAIRKDKKQTSNALTAIFMTNTPKDLRIVHDLSVDEVKEGFSYFINVYESEKR